MSVESHLKRICVDTAVYWASPTPATDGSMDYATGVEIKCFWNEETNMIKDDQGKEVVSVAKVHVTQDLVEQGMLYHGTLASLTAGEQVDPNEVDSAFIIKRFLKTPSLHLKDEYNRRAML